METLGINGLPNVTKLLSEEFIYGSKFEHKKRSHEEISVISELVKKMVEYHKWNVTKPIFGITSQKCEDMIVHIGTKLFKK